MFVPPKPLGLLSSRPPLGFQHIIDDFWNHVLLQTTEQSEL